MGKATKAGITVKLSQCPEALLTLTRDQIQACRTGSEHGAFGAGPPGESLCAFQHRITFDKAWSVRLPGLCKQATESAWEVDAEGRNLTQREGQS